MTRPDDSPWRGHLDRVPAKVGPCVCKGTPVRLPDGTVVYLMPVREGVYVDGVLHAKCSVCGGLDSTEKKT